MVPILKNLTFGSFSQILEIVESRQPLYPFFISIPLLFLGIEHVYKTALMVNGIFYVITIIVIYLIAKELLDKKVAFLTSLIFAFYGFPLFYLHFALQDTIVTSFIVLSLLFLAKLKNRPLYKYTLFFSLFFSLAALSRWTAPIFITGGILGVLISYTKKIISVNQSKINFFLKHLIIFLFFGILPALVFYYMPNSSFFIDYVSDAASNGSNWAQASIKNPFSKSSIIWYASKLAQQTILFWLLFLSGLFISITKFRKYNFLLFSFIIPYMVLTFGATWKEDRFISPVYPTMALISAVAINEIKKPIIIKQIIILLIIVIGFLNFLGASWGIGPMKFSIHGDRFTVPHSILVPMPIGHPRRIWLAPISWPPRSNEGNVPLILDTITKDFDYKKSKKPTLLLAFDFSQVSDPIAIKSSLENPALLTFSQLYAVEDYNTFFSKIKNTDYLLVKTGRIYDEPRRGQKVVHLIQVFNDALSLNNKQPPEAFKLIKKIFIPIDKSTLYIYKKKESITNEEWAEFAEKLIKVDPQAQNEIEKMLRK